jgi:hypothetical protein
MAAQAVEGEAAMIKAQAPQGAAVHATWQDTPTQTITVGGVEFAYRQLGPDTGVPVVFLTHLAAVLDNLDGPVAARAGAGPPVHRDDLAGGILTDMATPVAWVTGPRGHSQTRRQE